MALPSRSRSAAARAGTRGYGLLETLSAWVANGLLYGAVFATFCRSLARRELVAPCWVPLAACGAVAILGYAAFWSYFASPALGKALSAAIFISTLLANTACPGRLEDRDREWIRVAPVSAAIGLLSAHRDPAPASGHSGTSTAALLRAVSPRAFPATTGCPLTSLPSSTTATGRGSWAPAGSPATGPRSRRAGSWSRGPSPGSWGFPTRPRVPPRPSGSSFSGCSGSTAFCVPWE